VYQKTGKCRDCGVDIGRHCLRCKGCATRERNRLKRACRERNEESYVPAWRCPKCGNKIRTEVCYGCEVEQKQEALVWARKLFLGVNSIFWLSLNVFDKDISSMETINIVFILTAYISFFVCLLYVIFGGFFYGAMWMKLPKQRVEKMLELGKVSEDKLIYDLGAGFGNVAFQAHQLGARVVA